MLVILMFFRGNGFDADLYGDLSIVLPGTMNDKGALLYIWTGCDLILFDMSRYELK